MKISRNDSHAKKIPLLLLAAFVLITATPYTTYADLKCFKILGNWSTESHSDSYPSITHTFFRISPEEYRQKLEEFGVALDAAEIEAQVPTNIKSRLLQAADATLNWLIPPKLTKSDLILSLDSYANRLLKLEDFLKAQNLSALREQNHKLFNMISFLYDVARVDARIYRGRNFFMIPMAQDWPNEKHTYMDASLRKHYQLQIKNGLLWGADGKLFETSSAGGIFVMDGDGRIYAQKGDFNNHSQFLAGSPVAAAGHMTVIEGRIIKLSDSSGHYMPGRLQIEQMIEYLRALGIEVAADSISYYSTAETGLKFYNL